jgi:hypothetical protein
MPEYSRGVARARAFRCDAITTTTLNFQDAGHRRGQRASPMHAKVGSPHNVNIARVRVWRTWGPASCPFLIRVTSSVSPVSSVHAVRVRETGGQDHLDALRGRGVFSHVNLIETAT